MLSVLSVLYTYIYLYIYIIGNRVSSFQDMELSQKNIVGPPRPQSPGDVAIWQYWLSIYEKNIDLGKTIIHQVARKVKGRLLLMGHLVKLDAPLSVHYVQTSRPHHRREYTIIIIEAENINITDSDGEETC